MSTRTAPTHPSPATVGGRSRRPATGRPRWVGEVHALAEAPGGTRHVLALMLRLSPAETAALSAELGAAWAVRDGREVTDPDAVLLPRCSRQTTAAVRGLFPTAQLLVLDTSLDDPTSLELGPLHGGRSVYPVDPRDAAA